MTELSETQLELLYEIGVEDIDDAIEVEEKVSDFLMRRGFDEKYNPTVKGEICESILDNLRGIESTGVQN